MKRIAFLVTTFPSIARTFEINQILNAHKAGYQIRIFPQFLEDLNNSSQKEILERYRLMDKVIKPIPFYSNKAKRMKWLLKNLYRDRLKFIPYFIKSLNPHLFGIDGIILFVFHKVIQFHRNSDFDIYHCQYGPNGLIAAWLKELGFINGKIITTFHGYDAHLNVKYLRQHYYYLSMRTWSRLLFKHSDLITVNTPYLMKQLIQLGAAPDRIELLPMGVDTSFFLPKEHPQNKKALQLVSVGRLVKWKGHALGIQAVSNLLREGFNLKYDIIGDGPERHNLQRLAESLNSTDCVKICGSKSQSEIRDCLQESDVFLMTSAYDEIGRRETQGVVTAEAQACGLPVVAFRSGGIPYTLEEGKTGFLAGENNLTEFTKHLKELCANETLRKTMGRSARKFVEENFSQANLAKKQVSLYEKVLIN